MPRHAHRFEMNMANLHIRNVPPELVSRLQALAKQHNHSLSAEVIDLLERGLAYERMQRDQSELVAKIRRARFTYPEGMSVPDSVTLLRKDRER